jgi:hypothetical protein
MPSKERKAMYAVIGKNDSKPGTMGEVMQQVRESLLPILNRMAGLKAYLLVDVGDNQVLAISLFDTQADTKAAARPTAEWLATQNASVVRGFSEAMTGQAGPLTHPTPYREPTSQEELLRGCF